MVEIIKRNRNKPVTVIGWTFVFGLLHSLKSIFVIRGGWVSFWSSRNHILALGNENGSKLIQKISRLEAKRFGTVKWDECDCN